MITNESVERECCEGSTLCSQRIQYIDRFSRSDVNGTIPPRWCVTSTDHGPRTTKYGGSTRSHGCRRQSYRQCWIKTCTLEDEGVPFDLSPNEASFIFRWYYVLFFYSCFRRNILIFKIIKGGQRYVHELVNFFINRQMKISPSFYSSYCLNVLHIIIWQRRYYIYLHVSFRTSRFEIKNMPVIENSVM